MEGRTVARGRRLLAPIAIGALLLSAATISARATESDGYAKVAQVNVPLHTISCTFQQGNTTLNTSTPFSFDISWVAQARGEYLLAERSHGRPSHNTEGGMLSGATSGDLLLINTDDPGASPIYIRPPRNDPFAGHRCDINADFGGVVSGPPGHQSTRNEIEGPNGVFTVNDTEAWVGDGPSYFTPGQTDTAADYKSDPCDSSVRVFSLITRRQIDHINVHGCFRTDEGAFDPVDQIALWANPAEQPLPGNPRARSLNNSPFITLISTRPGNGDDRWGDDAHRGGHHEILKQINFDGSNGTPTANGGIEQAVYSRQTGLFYIAVPSKLDASGNPVNDGWVVTVDPRHHHHHFGEVHNYALKSGSCDGGPAGAALGPNHELLLGCGGSDGELVVDISNLAASTANPTATHDGSTSCDEVAYDAGSGHFGGACFVAPAFGVFGVLVNDAHTPQPEDFGPRTIVTPIAGPVTIAQSATIPGSEAGGAHSIAADSVNEEFWMPKVGGDCGSAPACVAVYGLGAGESDFSE